MKLIKPVFRKNHWTEHVKVKMRQYGLSKEKILSILRKPERAEQGIALGTNAVMRTNPTPLKFRGASKKFGGKPDKSPKGHLDGPVTTPAKRGLVWKPKLAPGEIWIMYKDENEYRKIISAWRYPGISKPGEEIPIPEDIRQELMNS